MHNIDVYIYMRAHINTNTCDTGNVEYQLCNKILLHFNSCEIPINK